MMVDRKEAWSWFFDLFQVALTLWLFMAAIEVARPGTFTSSIDMSILLLQLIVIGTVLVLTEAGNISIWLSYIDVILLTVILWVMPHASMQSRAAALVVGLAGIIYLYKRKKYSL